MTIARKPPPPPPPAELPTIAAELLEQFGHGPMTADAINAASLAFKKALIERALSGEMNCHPGYPSGKAKPGSVTNQRNRKGAKLEDELIQTEAMLSKARANVARLVQMNDLLATGKASAEASLQKALANVRRLNHEKSGLGRKLNSSEIVADQRDHLLRENQRLLRELKLQSLDPAKNHKS